MVLTLVQDPVWVVDVYSLVPSRTRFLVFVYSLVPYGPRFVLSVYSLVPAPRQFEDGVLDSVLFSLGRTMTQEEVRQLMQRTVQQVCYHGDRAG